MKQETELARKEAQEAERETRCSQLRNYANGLQQGIRIATVAPDGSLNRLDGNQRRRIGTHQRQHRTQLHLSAPGWRQPGA